MAQELYSDHSQVPGSEGPWFKSKELQAPKSQATGSGGLGPEGSSSKRRKQANPRRKNEQRSDEFGEASLQTTGNSEDLNGFHQLLACPFCQPGYQRLLSLNNPVLDRHLQNQEIFRCWFCSYSFTQRVQLEKHMAQLQPPLPLQHQPVIQQQPTKTLQRSSSHQLLSGCGSRKFGCSQCLKAFKYKHHLKEHLRIHSGEKPFECSICKKRFSHSGSYSSHISSNKCVSTPSLTRRLKNRINTKVCSSPNSSSSSSGTYTFKQLPSAPDNGRFFSLPEFQRSQNIKDEPMHLSEHQIRMSFKHGSGGSGTCMTVPGQDSMDPPPQRLLQQLGGVAVEPSLLGYAGTLKTNLSKTWKVWRKEIDQDPETFKLSAYTVEPHTSSKYLNSPTRSVIDYAREKFHDAKGLISESKKEMEMWKENLNHSKEQLHQDRNHFLWFSCKYCEENFSGPVPLQQHQRYMCHMNEEIRAVLLPETLSTNCLTPLELPTTDMLTRPGPFKDHMPVLKTYSAMKVEPNSEELLKISIAVGLGQETARECFHQWRSQNLPYLKKQSTIENRSGPGRSASCSPASANRSMGSLDHFPTQTSTWSPLNLSSKSTQKSQNSSDTQIRQTSEELFSDSPLDLSLSKHLVQMLVTAGAKVPTLTSLLDISAMQRNSGPSNSITIKTEVQGSDGGRNFTHLLHPDEAGNHAEASIPFFGSSTFVGCPASTSHRSSPPPTFINPASASVHRPYASLDPISFLPYLAYTSTGASFLSDLQPREKFQQMSAIQEELQCAFLDRLTEKASLLCRKKMKTDSGQRPHQCVVCHKAFKHKHHLMEHTRLHSGEKPYQCDKCGKRFSHSGSYSQHMNHRYSYCQREAEKQEAQRETHHPGAGGVLPSRRSEVLDPLGPLRCDDPGPPGDKEQEETQRSHA